jgi:phosphoribosylpyrophosphate synthetase
MRYAQESIRGCDVFLIQPSCPPVNDHLMELLVTIDACKRASARSITAVVPYYGYARADRKTQGRESIAAKLTANLLTEAGALRLCACGVRQLCAPLCSPFLDGACHAWLCRPLLVSGPSSRRRGGCSCCLAACLALHVVHA